MYDKPNPWYATKTVIDGEESFAAVQEESILKDFIEGKEENSRYSSSSPVLDLPLEVSSGMIFFI